MKASPILHIYGNTIVQSDQGIPGANAVLCAKGGSACAKTLNTSMIVQLCFLEQWEFSLGI
jgi:hypothetical protein